MKITRTYTLNLGAAYAGIESDLRARLIDIDGNNYGAEISADFTAIGNGTYMFRYDNFDDDFEGVIKFYDTDEPTEILAVGAINPSEYAHTLLAQKINLNKTIVDREAELITIYDTDGVTELFTMTIEDDGTKMTKGKMT